MDDWNEKINSILSDPSQMEKIMELAKSISGGEAECADNRETSWADFDDRILKIASRLMSEWKTSELGQENLLLTLKPFLKQSRKEALEKAIRMTKMAKAARFAIQEFSGGEDPV